MVVAVLLVIPAEGRAFTVTAMAARFVLIHCPDIPSATKYVFNPVADVNGVIDSCGISEGESLV